MRLVRFQGCLYELLVGSEILPESRELFSGTVMVYGRPVYIDIATGQGIEEVLRRMAGFIEAFGGWSTRDSAVEGGDLRQEAYAATIEGMRFYDPSRQTQLSTFLQRHVRNRMVDVCRRTRDMDALNTEVPVQGRLPEDLMDARRALGLWGERWGRIMVGVFVEGRSISEMAEREGMTPWGLSRAIKKRLAAMLKEMS